MWTFVLQWVATLALSYLTAPKPKSPAAAGIGDVHAPTAEVGREIPVLFGTRDLTGPNCCWYGDLRSSAIKKRSGFSKVTVGYNYYLGAHLVLCHGPVDAVTRIRVGDKTAWEGSTAGGQISAAADGLTGAIDVETGATSQGANGYLQARLGPVPAYRGVLGLVLRQVHLGQAPTLQAISVRARRILVRQHGLAQWYPGKAAIGPDMNPAHILRECLTDPVWGMGYPEADIDATSFTAAADALHAEGFGLSLLWDRSAELGDFIGEVLSHIDGSLFVDRGTGRFRLSLARGGYTVGALPLLDENNLVRIESYRRRALSEMINQVSVSWWDATTGQANSTTLQDTALAQQQGTTVSSAVAYPGITSASLAARVAARDLRALSTPLASCTVYATRAAAGLNVGDVFRLSWPRYGFDQLVMRVTAVELGALGDNAVRVQCVEDVFALSDAIYAGAPGSAWAPANNAPAAAPHRLLIDAPYFALLETLDATAAAGLPATAAYAMVTAQRPSSDAIDAAIWTNPTNTAWLDAGRVDFCPVAQLGADVGPSGGAWTITGAVDVDLVRVGSWALIDAEAVRIDAVSPTAITVGRGCLDTVPAAHTAGARIWFAGDYLVTDGREYAAGATARVRLSPKTALGELALASSPTDTLVTTARHARPYAPGNVRINGASYPASVSGAVTVTWAHRSRLLQTAEPIVDTTAASIGPEAGTTYTATLRRADTNAVLETQTGIAGTSAAFAITYEGAVVLHLHAVRGGVSSAAHVVGFVRGA